MSSFSIKELSKIKQYAFGMIGTTILVLLLTQIDKLILVKLITLKEYGYYTMAFSVANMLNLIMGPLSQAISPKFSQLVAKEDSKAIIEIYDSISDKSAAMKLIKCIKGFHNIYERKIKRWKSSNKMMGKPIK